MSRSGLLKYAAILDAKVDDSSCRGVVVGSVESAVFCVVSLEGDFQTTVDIRLRGLKICLCDFSLALDHSCRRREGYFCEVGWCILRTNKTRTRTTKRATVNVKSATALCSE